MKKMHRILSALALCLALVLLPMGAFAEPMPMVVTTISDPVLTMSGQTFLDMTGLEVNLTAGGVQDMSKGTLQLQVLGGGETALAGLVQIADGKVVLAADGLKDTYSISLESLMGMMDPAAIGGFQSGMALSQSLVALANGSLPEELASVIMEFAGEFSARMTDEGTVTYEMLSGNMEMQHMSLEIPAEMMDDVIGNILGVLDANPEFQAFLSEVAQVSGESGIAGVSLKDAYAQAGVSQRFEVDIYANEDGSCIALEMRQFVTVPDGNDEERIDYRVMAEQTGDGIKLYADADVYAGGEPEVGGYFAVQSNGATTGIEIGGGEYDDGEFEAEFKLTATEQPATINGNEGAELLIDVTSEGETASCKLAGYANGSQLYGEFSTEADGVAVMASFTGEATNDGLSGVIELSGDDGSSAYGLTANLAITGVQKDSAEVLIDAANSIDIESLSGEDMSNVTNSLSAVVINALSVLDRNVPGLSGIMASLMGGGY